MEKERVKIELVDAGPMIVKGNFSIVGSDSHTIVFSPAQRRVGVAICRCGKSATMPFCDGTHLKKR